MAHFGLYSCRFLLVFIVLSQLCVNLVGTSAFVLFMYAIIIHPCNYISMYVIMCACMYICMHVCVCMYVCMHACMYVYMCMYVCMYVCVYACMHVCIMYVSRYIYVCMKGLIKNMAKLDKELHLFQA